MLAKVISEESGNIASPRLLAATFTLKYYYNREAPNLAMKNAWRDEELNRLGNLGMDHFLDYPTRGKTWAGKLETIEGLIRHVHANDLSSLSDEAVVRSLKSLRGVGDQTAAMVSLFWLNRPVPIIDGYLTAILQKHQLVSPRFPANATDKSLLHRHLLQGAIDLAKRRPEWPAPRVLSCLYLWLCEVGRFHCRCEEQKGSPTCPIARARADIV